MDIAIETIFRIKLNVPDEILLSELHNLDKAMTLKKSNR
jgi:hypothetical protein